MYLSRFPLLAVASSWVASPNPGGKPPGMVGPIHVYFLASPFHSFGRPSSEESWSNDAANTRCPPPRLPRRLVMTVRVTPSSPAEAASPLCRLFVTCCVHKNWIQEASAWSEYVGRGRRWSDPTAKVYVEVYAVRALVTFGNFWLTIQNTANFNDNGVALQRLTAEEAPVNRGRHNTKFRSTL
jgi:hypothetical protein